MRKIIKNVLVFFFLPITFTILIIKPLIKIRWSKKDYFSDRVGHMVAEMEHYLYFNKNKSKFTIDLFPSNIFYNKNPSNVFLQKHYRKKITTINNKVLILLKESQKIIEKYVKVIQFDNFDNDLSTKDNFKIFKKNFKPSIYFSENQKKIILKNLGKIGIKKKKFVCVIVRDNKYLKEKLPGINFNYHNYRDSNIKTFNLAINYLIKKGYFILRMGKSQKKELKIKNKNFFDYSFSNVRSDLMDVWLMANCDFCISTGTGLDQISRIYNKPILFLNFLPLIDWSSHFRSLTHPKFLFDKKLKKFMSYQEHMNHSYFRQDEYIKNNIKIVDLNSSEILSCTKEFLLLIKNQWKMSFKSKIQQNNFRKSFLKYLSCIKKKESIDYHKNLHKDALISLNFLKSSKFRNINFK